MHTAKEASSTSQFTHSLLLSKWQVLRGLESPRHPPLPGKGALGRRSEGHAVQHAPTAPAAGPTPSKPMVKLFWDKLPEKQVGHAATTAPRLCCVLGGQHAQMPVDNQGSC